MGMTETEIPSYDGNCKNMTETDKFLNQRVLNNFKIKWIKNVEMFSTTFVYQAQTIKQ